MICTPLHLACADDDDLESVKAVVDDIKQTPFLDKWLAAECRK